MANAWHVVEPFAVKQAIDSIGDISTQVWPLGSKVRAKHSTQGEGEFVYLAGVASTVVGSLVAYDILNGTTTLSPTTVVKGEPLAVAMAATVASYYGWYQVRGAAVIKKTAVAISPGPLPIYQSATAGRIFGTSTSGKEVLNCVNINAATVASTTSTVTCLISHPFMQGQIT